MALLFLDGFDKYGAVNSNATVVNGLLTAGEWTTTSGTGNNIVAALSATGFALSLVNASSLTKTLAANYARLIGGLRFSSTLAAVTGIQFLDSATVQASIAINAAGTIAVRNAAYNTGTILGTSTASVTANSVHYLEWDITFANAGSYQLWLDGVSILSGSGDTTATTNNYANQIQLIAPATVTLNIDDLYLFDNTGATNNAVLLTSPRIETSFPSSDGAVQFAVGAAILGTSVSRNSTASNMTLNQWRVHPLTPTRNCTLNSVSFLPVVTNATINLRPIIYSDSSNLPNALMSAGSTVVGMTAGSVLTMPLTTPQSLIAGTQYWIGHMCDTAVSGGLTALDGTNTDRISTAVAFTSGAPATAPTGQSVTTSTLIWGNITGTGVNWYETSPNPAQGNYSYVFDSVVGQEDLYGLPNLSAPATSIYAVAVKANVAKSDAGAKTVSVHCLSGATDSSGTGGTAIAPGTSYTWVTSLYPTDPNTGAAWTQTAVNACQIGLRIES